MRLKPRQYQLDIIQHIHNRWLQGGNVLAVLPTGAGKTFTFSNIIHDEPGNSCAIAHRQELVSQISLALNRDEVPHKIIGPRSVVKLCCEIHHMDSGRSFYNPSALTAVAGVDTLIKRQDQLRNWANTVSLWVQDEAHHVLRENKWGTAVDMFPNAKGLGVTATPMRADGKGLGAHADGVFDHMVVGPSMRDLINLGYLTEYRIFAPPNDIDLSQVNISDSTGDYSKNKLNKAVAKSHITGDVVEHYLKLAPGKQGVTFATDVEIATRIAQRFNEAGVPAEVVSAKTPDRDRIAIINRFKKRELLQLVNVDLFGEGFDLPAIEVVSMARPTQSYGLYVQQFGRALRLLDGKEFALIIDHVGNVIRHGLPDAPREWTLDRRDKRSKSNADDSIPVKACPECTGVYERVLTSCPFCGHAPAPMLRGGPEQVDGDLIELDPSVLAQMRGEAINAVRSPAVVASELRQRHSPEIGIKAGAKRQRELLEAQQVLRHSVAWWCGVLRSKGTSDQEIYRRFYHKFKTDVLTAQTFKPADAMRLADQIVIDMGIL